MWLSWIYAGCSAWLIVSAFTVAHWDASFNLWNYLVAGIVVGLTTVRFWASKEE